MTTSDLKRIGRDARFAWVSLMIAILSASLLYAVLVINQFYKPFQLGLPFALMLVLLIGMYPPLNLQKRTWLCLRNQLVDLLLPSDGCLVFFTLQLLVIVTFVLVMASRKLVSTTQILLFLSFLLLLILVTGQWWDLLGNFWNKFAEYEKWERQLKKLFLIVPLAMISWLLWPFQSSTEHIQGWSLFAATACLMFALPLVVSVGVFFVVLAGWNLKLQNKLTEIMSKISMVSEKIANEKGWERVKNVFILAHNWGLVFGIILVLAVTLPLALIAITWLRSKSTT